ncbi:hypothetical protein DFH11DRAFT_912908 [Phellopilus nigrolimitatus]|nr:hypothetical protein DFH11DRAFT_912908 [Phellopilus nigrolimitatus]
MDLDRPNQLLDPLRPESHISIDSWSTWSHDMASNLPGPGRNLGLMFTFLGKHLEGWMNALAAELGFGPRATMQKILYIHQNMTVPVSHRMSRKARERWESRQETRIQRRCKRLLNYTHSHVYSTQVESLAALQSLALESTSLLFALRAVGAARHFETFFVFLNSRTEQYSGDQLLLLASMSWRLLKTLREGFG